MKLGSSFAKISKCNEYKTLEQYRAKNILRQITKEKFFLTGEQKYQNTHTEAPITQYVHLLTHSSPCPRCYMTQSIVEAKLKRIVQEKSSISVIS